MKTTRSKSAARQRILETADRLFYAEGVRAVGIDRIIAEAGVAKMTLYNHFSSKDELILAVLKYREAKVVDMFRTGVERYRKRGLDPLRAFFATLRDWFESPKFRGCAFINTSVELADAGHAAAQFVRQHKAALREMLKRLLDEFGGSQAGDLAPAVLILVEGAIVTAEINGSPDAADVARDAALTLVEQKTGKSS